jgi:hypothetical protein
VPEDVVIGPESTGALFSWEKLEHLRLLIRCEQWPAAQLGTAMIVATHAVDTIAIIILIAMMLVPLANIVTGAIVGTGLGGPAGGLVGIVLGIAITLISSRVGHSQTRQPFRPRGVGLGSYARHHVSPGSFARRGF